jgi:hypothetical protein
MWSHDYRLLPFAGGYLPVHDFLDSALQTGFRVWLSVELLDSKPKPGMSLDDDTKPPCSL